jgi:hypothetical protein
LAEDKRTFQLVHLFLSEIWTNDNQNQPDIEEDELAYDENISSFLPIIDANDITDFVDFSAKIAFSVTTATFKTKDGQNEFFLYILKMIQESLFSNFDQIFAIFFSDNSANSYDESLYKTFCEALKAIDNNFLSSTKAFKVQQKLPIAKLLMVILVAIKEVLQVSFQL